MDNELALRTIGYLIGYYKTHDETMINSQEIEAIDFLLEKNQELKKQLEVGEEQYNDLVEEKEKLQEQLSSNTLKLDNQQKEFIKWLQDESKELIRDAGYHQRICLEILSKYKEIIGDKDE